jgi:hypothetical protein
MFLNTCFSTDDLRLVRKRLIDIPGFWVYDKTNLGIKKSYFATLLTLKTTA